MASLKEQLATVAAKVTIAKMKGNDFYDAVRDELLELWEETEKAKALERAEAGEGSYEFEYNTDCGATRDEIAELLPPEVKAMRPFVWHSTSSPRNYEITLRWKDERDTLIREAEAERLKQRKRPRAEANVGQDAKIVDFFNK